MKVLSGLLIFATLAIAAVSLHGKSGDAARHRSVTVGMQVASNSMKDQITAKGREELDG